MKKKKKITLMTLCGCGHPKIDHGTEDISDTACLHVDDMNDNNEEYPCDCVKFHLPPKKVTPVKTKPTKTLAAVRAAMEAVKDKTKKGKKPKKQTMVILLEIRIDMDEYPNVKEDMDTTIEDLEGYGTVNVIDSGVVDGETS